MATVRHTLNHAEINRILRSPSGPVARDMLRRGRRVEAVAKRLVGVDSGRLRASIGVTPVIHRGAPAAKVGTRVRYAGWHHDGTGLYGPHRSRIYPRTKKALAFKIGGRRIVVSSTRGARGTFYLKRALVAARG